jgi:hypothetical protein
VTTLITTQARLTKGCTTRRGSSTAATATGTITVTVKLTDCCV